MLELSVETAVKSGQGGKMAKSSSNGGGGPVQVFPREASVRLLFKKNEI